MTGIVAGVVGEVVVVRVEVVSGLDFERVLGLIGN